MTISDLLKVKPGAVDLADYDPEGTPGFDGDKAAGEAALEELAPRLADLQEKLFAHGYTDGRKSLLLVIQGMDTSGKGGTLKHAVGIFDPGGIRIKSFKKPTREELAHDFLWRVEKEVPAHGYVGIFDRSHYEDVLVARVHELANAGEIERRYGAINDFERRLVDEGTTIVKCMLHISREEQRERLLARLDDETKQWKYKPGDVDERKLWDKYQEAYQIALERCSTEVAPWYVVPANKKWYRTWAIASLLTEALEAMELDWPAPSYDVNLEKDRVAAS
ncbi:MAG TPA: PPK2 family polyphosphate kinase [Nocardioidaceae bacterium]|nr:PPK2 family polyphosphate kinase [Nocardioidaceae bacterium]